MAKDRVERDDEDLVRLYLTDIGQYTLLTKDDEVRLAKAIEAGNEALAELDAGGSGLSAARKRELRRAARKGEEAERQFVQSNLRLVVSIAKKYQASGLPLLDLVHAHRALQGICAPIFFFAGFPYIILLRTLALVRTNTRPSTTWCRR